MSATSVALSAASRGHVGGGEGGWEGLVGALVIWAVALLLAWLLFKVMSPGDDD